MAVPSLNHSHVMKVDDAVRLGASTISAKIVWCRSFWDVIALKQGKCDYAKIDTYNNKRSKAVQGSAMGVATVVGAIDSNRHYEVPFSAAIGHLPDFSEDTKQNTKSPLRKWLDSWCILSDQALHDYVDIA